jgi:hypothetical protein
MRIFMGTPTEGEAARNTERRFNVLKLRKSVKENSYQNITISERESGSVPM